MSTVKNGNGSGTNGLLHNANKKTAATANPPKSGSKENLVTFRTHEGLELRGVPLRTTRHLVVFELYNPSAMPRLSEALEKFAIVFQERVDPAQRCGDGNRLAVERYEFILVDDAGQRRRSAVGNRDDRRPNPA